MHETWVIARKDIREALRNRSTYFSIAIMFLITISFFGGAESVINRAVAEDGDVTGVSRALVNNLLNTLPLLQTMLIGSFFAAYAVIMDKARRTIESLLATPVTLRQIWLGKALAVVIPSVIIAILITVVVLLVMEFMIIIPQAGTFVLPDGLPLLTGLVMIPLVAFMVIMIVTGMQLVMSNPRIANLAFTAIFLLIYFGTITEFTRNWDFSLIYLVILGLLGGAVYTLDRFITREKVVLSSKG